MTRQCNWVTILNFIAPIECQADVAEVSEPVMEAVQAGASLTATSGSIKLPELQKFNVDSALADVTF